MKVWNVTIYLAALTRGLYGLSCIFKGCVDIFTILKTSLLKKKHTHKKNKPAYVYFVQCKPLSEG